MATTKWEYRLEVIHLGGKNDGAPARGAAAATLDALGQEGWEAGGFSPSNASSHGLHVETPQFVVLLKRPKRPAKGK